MNKKILKLFSFCLICLICFASCERYPVRALLGIPEQIDSWPDIWYLYDDEINTKGSLAPFKWERSTGCADWDKVKLDFACKYHPKMGRNCMQLTWVVNSNDPSSSYFGFGLMAREYGQVYKYIDLSTSDYENLKFWIRGTLYNNCSFEISIPKNETEKWVIQTIKANELSSDWTEIVVSLKNVIDEMTKIEYDIAISLVADVINGEPSITNGGTVYLDDIRFTKD